jgi:hypothetical protein
MPIDWKSPESLDRLLAALVAASDHKVGPPTFGLEVIHLYYAG